MSAVETVKIKHATLGSVIINRTDFNPTKHELFAASQSQPEVSVADEVTGPGAELTSAPPTPDEVKSKLRSLTLEDLGIALLSAPNLEAVILAEQAEDERVGGPRKGALKLIADRRGELEAQQPQS